MNKVLKYIIGSLLPLALLSCIKEEMPQIGNETIVLSINSGIRTKAVADTDIEAKVSHIDVLIFDDSETLRHHERINDNGTNRYTLAARRSSFTANAGYHVYLVANSSDDAASFSAIDDLADLKAKINSSSNLIFTGLNGEGDPQSFLMDAVAYQGAAEPSSPGTVKLNDGVLQNNTELKAVLRRAAAKIFVKVNKGAAVTFATESADVAKAEYFMRNHPYTTPVISGVSYIPSLASTARGSLSEHFKWSAASVSITAYAYAHDWKNESVLEKESSLIVNIPLTYNGVMYDSNWYKIPVSKDSRFDRNTYYEVTVTVNAPGAKSVEDPVVLDDMKYSVTEWNSVTVSVGGDSNRPKYLQLNTNAIEMYNVNEDKDQLTFASSSQIRSITLDEAYYYNKHGVKTNVASDIFSKISATVQAGALNGNITVFSPIVATTAEERAAMIAELGPQPPKPSGNAPVNPEVPYAAKPNPDDYLPSSDWYTYYYEGTEGNYTFYRQSKYFGGATEQPSIKANYDADYAKYQAYQNWIATPDKEAKMEAYKAELEAYETVNQAYTQWQAKVNMINSTATPSHYNTIRYLTFTVENEDGLTQTFTVAQYPVIYITNSLGWYSYRKDFKTGSDNPTTYQYKGDRIVSVSLSLTGNGAHDWKNSYSTSGNNGYWFSKVRTGSNTTGNTQVSYYYWNQNSNNVSSQSRSTDNVRMYHVHVTTTSKDYVVARPKMVYDDELGLEVTDPSEDNSHLVSPSFMIASRLGYFITNGGNLSSANDAQRLEIFRVHCANYVEVHGNASNPIVYDNWRLPTEAELKIIMETQGEEGQNAAAVDYLLNAGYYFGAAGPVWNSKNDDNIPQGGSTSSKSVRCVRDAY